jgi:ribonuclease E
MQQTETASSYELVSEFKEEELELPHEVTREQAEEPAVKGVVPLQPAPQQKPQVVVAQEGLLKRLWTNLFGSGTEEVPKPKPRTHTTARKATEEAQRPSKPSGTGQRQPARKKQSRRAEGRKSDGRKPDSRKQRSGGGSQGRGQQSTERPTKTEEQPTPATAKARGDTASAASSADQTQRAAGGSRRGKRGGRRRRRDSGSDDGTPAKSQAPQSKTDTQTSQLTASTSEPSQNADQSAGRNTAQAAQDTTRTATKTVSDNVSTPSGEPTAPVNEAKAVAQQTTQQTFSQTPQQSLPLEPTQTQKENSSFPTAGTNSSENPTETVANKGMPSHPASQQATARHTPDQDSVSDDAERPVERESQSNATVSSTHAEEKNTQPQSGSASSEQAKAESDARLTTQSAESHPRGNSKSDASAPSAVAPLSTEQSTGANSGSDTQRELPSGGGAKDGVDDADVLNQHGSRISKS